MVKGYVVVLALGAAALFDAPAIAQRATDMKLEDAGFVMREANTPRQMERLRSVPPRKFVARSRNGVRYYVYADPTDCKCVFVGNQAAYDRYRAMVATYTPPPGYTGPVDARGVDPEREIILGQDEDMETGLEREDDIFNPGF